MEIGGVQAGGLIAFGFGLEEGLVGLGAVRIIEFVADWFQRDLVADFLEGVRQPSPAFGGNLVGYLIGERHPLSRRYLIPTADLDLGRRNVEIPIDPVTGGAAGLHAESFTGRTDLEITRKFNLMDNFLEEAESIRL